jgi:hypothetical protein
MGNVESDEKLYGIYLLKLRDVIIYVIIIVRYNLYYKNQINSFNYLYKVIKII